MSADLHIHILDGITEVDLADFNANTLGSKWFNPRPGPKPDSLWEKMGKTPQIWIGEVSWLKAALFGDSDSYVPTTVATISELIGEELPIVDDALITAVLAAFDAPNNTIKPDGVWNGEGYQLAKPDEVKAFLERHKGKRVFTVSW